MGRESKFHLQGRWISKDFDNRDTDSQRQKFANAAFGNNDKNELNCWMALDENNEKK